MYQHFIAVQQFYSWNCSSKYAFPYSEIFYQHGSTLLALLLLMLRWCTAGNKNNQWEKKNWTGIRWDSVNSPYFLDRKKKIWISLKLGGYIQIFMAKDFVEGNQNCAWKWWYALDSVKLMLRTMEMSFLMVQKCILGSNYCAHKFSGVQWDIHVQGKKPIGDELLKQLPIWV